MAQIEVSETKRFDLPPFKKIFYKNRCIVVSPLTAKWLVLDNKHQEEFFDMLTTHSVGESLDQHSGTLKDAEHVVLQLLLVDFENKNTISLEPPMALHIYVTNGCNLHCAQCYMSAGTKFEDELSENEIREILKVFSKEGGQRVTFSGGEPTMRTDILNVIRFAKLECGLETEVFTNGILWAGKSNTFYKNLSEILDFIQLSVDGYSEKKNSSIRGNDIFDKVLGSIDKYTSVGIRTTLAITPRFTYEKEEVEEYIQFAHSILGKNDSKLFRLIVSARILDGRGEKLSDSYKIRHRRLVNQINLGVWGENADTDILEILTTSNIKNNCAYGNVTIAADGRAFFCSRITEMKEYDNIRRKSFRSIIKKAQEAQKKSRIENLHPCNQCELMNICGGDCRIEYFKNFQDCSNIDFDLKNHRNCNPMIKNEFYDLMIESMERLYETL